MSRCMYTLSLSHLAAAVVMRGGGRATTEEKKKARKKKKTKDASLARKGRRGFDRRNEKDDDVKDLVNTYRQIEVDSEATKKKKKRRNITQGGMMLTKQIDSAPAIIICKPSSRSEGRIGLYPSICRDPVSLPIYVYTHQIFWKCLSLVCISYSMK